MMPAAKPQPTAGRSFYVTGGTLRPDAPSYVDRQADRDLYDGLQRGEYCYVLTPRQMGKSSLMVRTATRLRQEGAHVVVLDLTAIGQNLTTEQWYDGLRELIGQDLQLEDELEEFWLAHPRLGPLQRWMAAVREVVLARCPGQVVLFVDEIDAVRGLPFSTDELFAAIRACYNRRTEDPAFARLTFCLLGVATPSDLIQDTRTTPFNIGRRIELEDFTEAEAAPLAEGLVGVVTPADGGRGRRVARSCRLQDPLGPPPLRSASLWVPRRRRGRAPRRAAAGAGGRAPGEQGVEQGDRVRQALLNRVLYWTGGHPYLTQRLCQAVAAELSVGPSPRRRTLPSLRSGGYPSQVVDGLCEALFLSSSARERDDNLLFVRERLLRSEADLASLLDLYTQVRRGKSVRVDETNPLVSLLRLSGITRVKEGCLSVRNRIYARVFDQEWVRTHMPDAELRRQRAAFRRGLLRATMVAAVVLALMGALAAAAVYQAREAHRQQRLAEARAEQQRRDLYVRSMSVAQQALDDGNQGRARDLVEQQQPGRGQADLRGWEWRYLWRRCQSDSFLTLPGPTQPDGGVAFSPDGRTLALAGKDLKVRLWKLARSPDARGPVTLQGEPALLTGCIAQIRMLAFSPDGRALAAAGYENAIRLWDVATRRAMGDPLPLSDGGVTGPGLAFSATGLLAARDGSSVIRLWDSTRRWRALPPIRARGEFQTNPALAFSPDGKLLAFTAGKTVQLRRLADGRETTLKGHSSDVFSVAFSPDGKALATSSVDETVGLWDAATGRRRASLKGHSAPVIPVAFAPDGRIVASGGMDTTIRLWDAQTGQARATLMGHGGAVTVIALSPDGKTLASTGLDGTARLWSTAPRPAAVVLPGQERMVAVWYLAFSGDGRRLATGALDGVARLWDLDTNRPPRLFQVDPKRNGAVQVALSPDGETLVAALGDPTTFGRGVRAWNVATGTEIFRLDTRGVYALAFSPDGRHLALTTLHDRASAVELWDIHRRRRAGRLPGGTEWLFPLAFSPDGRILAGGSREGSLRLWDMEGGRLLGTLSGHTDFICCLAFSPDGSTLASAGVDGTVRLWDVSGRREQLPAIRTRGAVASGLAFSRDGRTLAMANQTRGVPLWNVETRQQVATLTGHELGVASVAFSPDGNTLATGAYDRTVRLWRAPPVTEIDAPGGAGRSSR